MYLGVLLAMIPSTPSFSCRPFTLCTPPFPSSPLHAHHITTTTPCRCVTDAELLELATLSTVRRLESLAVERAEVLQDPFALRSLLRACVESTALKAGGRAPGCGMPVRIVVVPVLLC
jgi:hypothetical protein